MSKPEQKNPRPAYKTQEAENAERPENPDLGGRSGSVRRPDPVVREGGRTGLVPDDQVLP